MRSVITGWAVCLISAHAAWAAVSLRFAGTSSALTGLSNPGGTVGINGLTWGILVDTAGDGFAPRDQRLDTAIPPATSFDWSDDDVFFVCGSTVNIQIGADPGPGSPGTVNELEIYSDPRVSAGDAFAIVWFEAAVSVDDPVPPGTAYGILTQAGLTLPPDGAATTSYQFLFAGPDPVRPADQAVSVSLAADTTGSVVDIDPGGGAPVTRHLAFTFNAHVDTLAAVSVTLQKSTTLLEGSWQSLPASPGIIQDNGTTQLLRIVDPDPVGTDPRRFLRLEVTP